MSYKQITDDLSKKIVWLEDNGDGMSITNDAERVLDKYKALGYDTVIYKDTNGEWTKMYYGEVNNWMNQGIGVVFESWD